jgi:mRNA interferase RelE/StbE
MYTVRILKAAAIELKQLDKSVGLRIVKRINWLTKNCDKINHQSLKGDLAGLYKLREGDYRIIYQILRKDSVILIHGIGHRREIYRVK